MNLSIVLARLKKFKLKEYNSTMPIVFIEASDADDACHKAVYNLAHIIMKQDPSQETIDMLKELSHDIRIVKVDIADEKML